MLILVNAKIFSTYTFIEMENLNSPRTKNFGTYRPLKGSGTQK